MDKLFEFFTNHWELWLLFFIFLLLWISMELRGRMRGLSRLQPQDAIRMLNHEKAVMIDVRDTNHYKDGHILGSINMPISIFADDIKKLDKYKQKIVVLVCTAGVKASQDAGALLKQRGFEQVHMIHGGINAWKQQNLPLEKGK